jgi:hypothetical protein
MKKSIALLILGLGVAIGVTAAQFPPLRASAQPVMAVPDDSTGSLQALSGQSVRVTLIDGVFEGKVLSVKDGWITLDTGNNYIKGQPIIRIPFARVSNIESAK